MIKKAIKIIGYLSVVVGFVSFFPNLNYILTTKSTAGKIVEILQRKSGVEYESVDEGGNYPCKLRFSFIDSQNNPREGLTSIEADPCGHDRVGDVVDIRYSMESKRGVERNDFGVWFGFPLIFVIFGTGLVIFSGKLLVKKK